MLALHLLVASDAGLTPCQQCCAPGGDCSKAYKGTPGKCCGEIGGQSFCCPGVSYRGPTSGDAKCYNCGSAYRCFSSATAGNVCGVASPTWRHYRGFRGEYSYEGNGGLGVVFIGILFVVVVLSCARGRRDASMPYGVPVGGVPVGASPTMTSALCPGSVGTKRTRSPISARRKARSNTMAPPGPRFSI